MPEHAHVLLWPTEVNYNIGNILNSIKQSVAKRALHFVMRETPRFLARMEDRQPNGKTHYRSWQRGGGYDRNMVEPGTAHKQIDYIHQNPVRRGLCASADDWFWSSAAAFTRSRIEPLPIEFESLPVLSRF